MTCSCHLVIYVNLKCAHYIHSKLYLEVEIILVCFQRAKIFAIKESNEDSKHISVINPRPKETNQENNLDIFPY